MKYASHRVLRVPRHAAARVLHRLACRRALVTLGLGSIILTSVIASGIRVNLSASAPRGLYRAVSAAPVRGTWVAACVSADAAALGRARGYLGPGPCAGGAEPVLKPIVAVSGDVVELGPQAVVVNGDSLPGSASASLDRSGRPLPHAIWGRHVVAADEVWLISTGVPNSWDSRYLGPFSISQVRAVARPVWTLDSIRPGHTEPQSPPR